VADQPDAKESAQEPKLTHKQSAFVEQYLIDFNATRAAVRAGYSPKTAASIGSENLKKPEISRAIKARLAELKMGADEVLTRLADHARSTMADFVDPAELPPVLGKAAESGKLHLVKTVRTTRRFFKGDLVEEKTEFELYDAQAALVQIGKHHQLFVQRQELTGKDGGPIEISDARAKLAQLLDNAAAREPAEGDPGATDGEGS
jgi:phage terminase small subunit